MGIVDNIKKIIYEIENPETIIIKNKYYPEGLTERQIFNHYKRYKNIILKEISGNPTVLFLQTDKGIVVKRKGFVLNSSTYEKIIHPRVIGITLEIKNPTNLLILDIDGGNISDQKKIINYILTSKIFNFKKYRIINTSSGFHIHLYLSNYMDVDTLRIKTRNKLNLDKFLSSNFLIDKKGQDKNKTNIDLSIITNRGSYTVPYSINRNSGLIAKDISRDWKDFTFGSSKIN